MTEPHTITISKKNGGGSISQYTEPPPIPHITSNYLPLSQIIASLTIHSHAELQNILETLPSVKSDLAKKRRLLDYLVKSRREFVKLYVLTKWTNVSEDISKCIDVVSWLTGQQNCFANVVNVLYTIERGLGGAKMRNPDIETALEVLKFGKPTQKSYHDFIPLKPLSPKLVLSTLHDLNVLLSIRLALTEELPSEYRNYEISDGRVKFTIAESFIVDLGVADDTVDAQFFFIDFRFCFEGCNKINLPITVSSRLEKIVNSMLADKTKSVSDVFHWLLRFTQNYKLSIINDQLASLEKGLWSGVLNHQFYPDKSLLMVNYWINRPGLRNVIRIGLSKTHKIIVHWQREGRDVDLPTNSTVIESFGNYDLNVEGLINEIINLHIRYIVENIYNVLNEGDNNNDSIASLSSTKIKIQLCGSKYITFSVDPLGGRCVLQNPTLLILSAERNLNELTDLVNQGPDVLFKLRYISLQEEITQRSKAAGWVANSNVSISSDDMKRHFYDNDPNTVSVFSLRLPHWAPSWSLLISLGRNRCPKWFMSRLQSKDKLWNVLFLEALNINLEDPLAIPDYRLFDQLSKFITSRFMINGICHELDIKKAKYSLLQGTDDEGNKRPAILVNLNTLTKNSWAHSSLLVVLNSQKGLAILQGRTKNSLSLEAVSDSTTTTTTTTSGVNIDPSTGRFMLQIPLSSSNEEGSFINSVISKLSKIERMVSYVELIKTMSLHLREASMSKITFEYGEDLSATVLLNDEEISDDASAQSISFTVSPNSPHSRVSAHLQTLLDERGLLPVVWLLRTSLPIYLSLQELEKTSPTPIIVVCRSVVDIRVIYPKYNTSIELQLLKRHKKDVIYVKEVDVNFTNSFQSPSIPAPVSPFKSASIWKDRFSHPSIIPLGEGAVCPVDQINIVLAKVTETLSLSK